MHAYHVPYLSDVQLVGSIYEKEPAVNNDDTIQAVSLVQSNFFVDHTEPLAALAQLQDNWVLGPLLDGHEFLVVLPATSVRRSSMFLPSDLSQKEPLV